jgi:Flp pilus assembly protein TadG
VSARRETLLALARDNRATAAVEMVLCLPFMFALVFGALELGYYFMTEHAVIKAVRDGARYAARRPFTDYPSCSPSSGLVDDTRNVTRTGQIASGGTPRFASWDDPTSIDVTATCVAAGTYNGIYVDPATGAPVATPVVTVRATVPYTLLMGRLGLGDVTLSLHAQSEAAVTGI